METAAPDLTETKSGFFLSLNLIPILSSSFLRFSSICFSRPSGYFLPNSLNRIQVSVVMVKPGGTGSPIFVISDKFAPLPPKSFFISLVPSPKKYTYCLSVIYYPPPGKFKYLNILII